MDYSNQAGNLAFLSSRIHGVCRGNPDSAEAWNRLDQMRQFSEMEIIGLQIVFDLLDAEIRPPHFGGEDDDDFRRARVRWIAVLAM